MKFGSNEGDLVGTVVGVDLVSGNRFTALLEGIYDGVAKFENPLVFMQNPMNGSVQGAPYTFPLYEQMDTISVHQDHIIMFLKCSDAMVEGYKKVLANAKSSIVQPGKPKIII